MQATATNVTLNKELLPSWPVCFDQLELAMLACSKYGQLVSRLTEEGNGTKACRLACYDQYEQQR